ncbi:MAG: 30S ribosomal protein S8 [Candidatus Hodgkinia cicadicola]
MVDSIANMLSHIKNCVMAKKNLVYIPYSRYKLSLLLAIRNCGFFKRISVLKHSVFKSDILIELNYTGGMPLIHNIIQISKSGNRVYWNNKQLKKAKHQVGVYILSTNKGIRTSLDLPIEGGEVVCKFI